MNSNKIPCPSCSKDANVTYTIQEIPNFGEALITTIICKKCGYKFTDVMPTEQQEPSSYKAIIESLEDLRIKIIRSSSGTIIVPELGIELEPGSFSQGFITNMEGVLVRMQSAVQVALNGAEDQDTLLNSKKVLEDIEKAKEGNFKFTVIVKDPLGRSILIGEKVEKVELTKEEIKELKKGFIDLSSE